MGYADDTGATTEKIQDLSTIARATDAFAKSTGQELNADKSTSWCIGSQGIEALTMLTVCEGGFARVAKLRCLGAHIRTVPKERNDTLAQRFEEGFSTARRIAWTQLPFTVKAELIASLVVPASLYGIPVGGETALALHNLRAACLKAVWGQNRKLRAKELVFTLLLPGHSRSQASCLLPMLENATGAGSQRPGNQRAD